MSEQSETPFRVYVLHDGDQHFLAAADDLSLGDLLLDLREQGKITDHARVGILYRPVEGGAGIWLSNPYA